MHSSIALALKAVLLESSVRIGERDGGLSMEIACYDQGQSWGGLKAQGDEPTQSEVRCTKDERREEGEREKELENQRE